jgi:hypothetical protein
MKRLATLALVAAITAGWAAAQDEGQTAGDEVKLEVRAGGGCHGGRSACEGCPKRGGAKEKCDGECDGKCGGECKDGCKGEGCGKGAKHSHRAGHDCKGKCEGRHGDAARTESVAEDPAHGALWLLDHFGLTGEDTLLGAPGRPSSPDDRPEAATGGHGTVTRSRQRHQRGHGGCGGGGCGGEGRGRGRQRGKGNGGQGRGEGHRRGGCRGHGGQSVTDDTPMPSVGDGGAAAPATK